jgi:hypothetical protein
MAKQNFIEGKLYKVRFYDHCIGKIDKMICEVVGWCIVDEADHVVLSHWIVDTDDAEVKRDNIEPVSIIKSCILRKRKLS